MNPSIYTTEILKVRAEGQHLTTDSLAVEEPLEIRLGFGGTESQPRTHKTVSITMRTPGHDGELAAGFLFTEGILKNLEQVKEFTPCRRNVIRVELKAGIIPDIARLERNFYTSSSCGVCGKTSIEALRTQTDACTLNREKSEFRVSREVIHRLPQVLKEAQRVFESTGGLHASALFSGSGELHVIREDVGRHNALDKVIGSAFFSHQLPISNSVLLVSGRASFELVQKAAMAGIPVLAAVGAPSSLAVQLAQEMDLSLLGFVRDGRFNVYHGEGRII